MDITQNSCAVRTESINVEVGCIRVGWVWRSK